MVELIVCVGCKYGNETRTIVDKSNGPPGGRKESYVSQQSQGWVSDGSTRSVPA